MYSGLIGIRLPLCTRDGKTTLMHHFEVGKTTALI